MSFSFETATMTHTGKVRKVNEDSLFSDSARGIWIIADGMGGHSDGGIASSMITESVRQMVVQKEPKSQLRSRLLKVNQDLLNRSNEDQGDIVGSTVAALMADDQRYICIWAGDSRCYLVRGGQIAQVSRDHTEVQELLNSGVISPEEARNWHRKNVITRAVGAASDLELEQVHGSLKEGDCFILCSDGLTGHVSDAEILSSVTWADPKHACGQLLELALERGGKDNISVIVVQVRLTGKTVIVRKD